MAGLSDVLEDKSLALRLASGTPLVFFQSKNFDDAENERARISAHIDAFKLRFPEARVLVLPNSGKHDPTKERVKLIAMRNECSAGVPHMLLVAGKLHDYERQSARALSEAVEIEEIFLADTLTTCIVPNAIILDEDAGRSNRVRTEMIPMTPIEERLFKGMKDAGLDVDCQISFDQYIVDFIVSNSRNRIAVEADGAAFHQAERDAERDRILRERYGLRVERFSGSRIFQNTAECVARIEKVLAEPDTGRQTFRYEGLENLDASQRAAVDHVGGHARVLAPAGSGKTKVLVNRAVKLLNRGCSPSSLLILAFNNKAARQIDDRLKALGIPVSAGPRDGTGVTVVTFNAFGARLLKAEGYSATLLDNPKKEKDFVRGALQKQMNLVVEPTRGFDPLGDCVKMLSRVRRGLQSPLEERFEVRKGKETINIPLLSVWDAVRSRQLSENVLTFDDQIYLPCDLLLSDHVVRRKWQAKFDHVLVDEYQDLNTAQILLLRLICGQNAQVFAVGDDDQCIYSWREASVQNLLDAFISAFPGTKDYPLEINYRCPKPIVRCSQRLIGHNKNRNSKTIVASSTAPSGTLAVTAAAGFDSLGQELVRFIQTSRSEMRARWNDVAILTRTKIQLLQAAVALDRAKIPRGPLPSLRLYAHTVGKTLRSYLAVCRSPYDACGSDFTEIINRPNRFVTNNARDLFKDHEYPWAYLNDLAYGPADAPKAERHVIQLINDIRHIHQLSRRRDVCSIDLIDAICERFPFVSKTSRNIGADADDETDDVILHVIRQDAFDYSDLNAFLAHAEQKARQEEGGDETGAVISDREENEDEERVALSTIHGAKGREWPIVCMFDTTQSGNYTSASPTAEEEERRLFYVGMTRAKSALQISFIENRPVRFVEEALSPIQNLCDVSSAKIERWFAENAEKLIELDNDIKAIDKRLAALAGQREDLKAGRVPQRFLAQLTANKDKREQLQRRLVEVTETRPSGILGRIFGSGMSGEEISKLIGSIERQITAAEADISSLEREIQSVKRDGPMHIAKIEHESDELIRDRKRTEKARQSVIGDREDLDRVRAVLPSLRGKAKGT